MIVGLCLVLLSVLALPFIVKQIEENLEVFLFIMGICATWISGTWTFGGHFNWALLNKVVRSPIMITITVFLAGILFKVLQPRMKMIIDSILNRISFRVFFFLLVVVLGLASSMITAIIASLVLVEVINVLKLERKQELALNIIACFSIGLGAVLTPVGEPLATIAISKLERDFLYLMNLLGIYIIPGIIALGCFAAFYIKPKEGESLSCINGTETYKDVLLRTVKVYLFVMSLELLGEGFKPVVDMYVVGLHDNLLYWLNIISAVLDNATLTAAEVSVKMSAQQIKCILLGLLISGGMLIPGNIPNIITASKLKIGSREWARVGIPLGLSIMVIFFVILNIL